MLPVTFNLSQFEARRIVDYRRRKYYNESVRILIHDIPKHNVAVAGVLASEKKE